MVWGGASTGRASPYLAVGLLGDLHHLMGTVPLNQGDCPLDTGATARQDWIWRREMPRDANATPRWKRDAPSPVARPRPAGLDPPSMSRRNGRFAQTDAAAVFKQRLLFSHSASHQAANLGNCHKSFPHSLRDFIPGRGNIAGNALATRTPNSMLRPI